MFYDVFLCPKCNGNIRNDDEKKFRCLQCDNVIHLEKGILDLYSGNIGNENKSEPIVSYDSVSENYNATRGIGTSLLAQGLFFIDSIKGVINDPKIILDLGSGTGLPSIEIATKVKQVIALDISKKMLNRLMVRAKINNVKNIFPVRADVYKLPIKNNSLEVVTCHKIFHLLQQRIDVVKEIKRVLSDNGLFFILIPITEVVERYYPDCDIVNNLYISAIDKKINMPTFDFHQELKNYFNYSRLVASYNSDNIFDRTFLLDILMLENGYTGLQLAPENHHNIIHSIENELKNMFGHNWRNITHSKARQNYYVYMYCDIMPFV